MAKEKKSIEQYDHKGKQRVNNPPVGLVDPETDKDAGKKAYAYDPHIDPALQFDCKRSEVEQIIDDGLSADTKDPSEAVEALQVARKALLELKKRQEPYLNWSGKAERTSFDVPTVSLHVHERIDPRTIIEAVRKKREPDLQPSLFECAEENPPIHEAIEFYKHKHNWSNRLIAGDSLVVMNSLLEKEGLGGQVQMIYIDPPYGIKYGSNFQPFVNKRDVKDGKDEDLTQEPEMIKAFRDTWELGVHSYLAYLRDRLLLARELLTESGSVFVQISDENLHLVRNLLDDVFGASNFIAVIPFRKKTMPFKTKLIQQMYDFLIWYARSKWDSQEQLIIKYRKLFRSQNITPDNDWCWYEMPDGTRHKMSKQQLNGQEPLPDGCHIYRLKSLEPSGTNQSGKKHYPFHGKDFFPPRGGWGTDLETLESANRIQPKGELLNYVLFFKDYQVTPLTSPWTDTVGPQDKCYVVQTNDDVIARCIHMTTDPGDLVLDPTCGSGTTAFVAEQLGRRWITCDTSRVAVTLAKQRLMTSAFDYYRLAHPEEGIGSGFKYKTVPHITLESITNNEEIDRIYGRLHPGIESALEDLNKAVGLSLEEWEVPFELPEGWDEKAKEPFKRFRRLKREMQKKMDESIQRNADQETLYDQPYVDKSKLRITGPFTVESVPAPVALPLDEIEPEPMEADESVARSGETLRKTEWREELQKTGIRGKNGQRIEFTRLEPLAGTRWLHADGETKEANPQRVVVSFGSEFAPLEQRQVELALEEARSLVPKPKMVVFASFQFDPEASKDIDGINWPGITVLKVQMNTDLLTDDLKKKRSNNESFWLIGQPDVNLFQLKDGENAGKYVVEVAGFDYYNTKTGAVESGGTEKIAVWMLDTDYDGRSLYPRQVFFPMSDTSNGWLKLAKNLNGEIDHELIEAYRGTVSLPFEAGEYKRVAVKIVDDRGIESLKIIEVE
ncbi:MAG: site-specific DNA-methyltransferase [Armatimonadota bacterium]